MKKNLYLLLLLYISNISSSTIRVAPSPFKQEWQNLLSTLERVRDQYSIKHSSPLAPLAVNLRVAEATYNQLNDLIEFFSRYLYPQVMGQQIDTIRLMQSQAQQALQLRKARKDTFEQLVNLMKQAAQLSIHYASVRKMTISHALQWVSDTIMIDNGFVANLKNIKPYEVTPEMKEQALKSFLSTLSYPAGITPDSLSFKPVEKKTSFAI